MWQGPIRRKRFTIPQQLYYCRIVIAILCSALLHLIGSFFAWSLVPLPVDREVFRTRLPV
jgi:hypothetical protein